MVTGKIIAGTLGFMVGDFIGAVIGVYIGHQFDKGLGGFLNPISAAEQGRIRESFFTTVFSLLGSLAKADGQISKVEIAQAEALMNNMGLSASHRREAIELFQQGAKADLSVDDAMGSFMDICGRHNNLKRQLLNYLISLALADGELHDGEHALLRKVAEHLGFSVAMFDQFIAMIKAQSQFKGAGSGPAASAGQLDSAYAALGVKKQNSDSEIKKAYRKLISQNHPDKLIGQGMPADMVKLATERTQEIQTAYELVVDSRK
ncbi:MAG: co-chaperone DjlA [Porticoccaceae bacterium]|jgi:DnaJ like chaperone protein|tara:strand:+ start:703 stop:1488 length:786 start_codon:yes stop_codon:yes gene_type:complete